MKESVDAHLFVWPGNTQKAKCRQRRSLRREPMAADFWILATSFSVPASTKPPYCRSEIISAQFVVPTRKKSFKKGEKKLVRTSGLPLEGEFERQMPSFCRSKKIRKSEKKACQGLRNSISLLKPNQTNGETNDTTRTKNA